MLTQTEADFSYLLRLMPSENIFLQLIIEIDKSFPRCICLSLEEWIDYIIIYVKHSLLENAWNNRQQNIHEHPLHKTLDTFGWLTIGLVIDGSIAFSFKHQWISLLLNRKRKASRSADRQTYTHHPTLGLLLFVFPQLSTL